MHGGLSDRPSTLPGMVLTEAQIESIREDLRAISDTVSDLVTRVAAHDGRFDQVDRRFDQVDGRLDGFDGRLGGIDDRLGGIDGTLQQILALVGGPQP